MFPMLEETELDTNLVVLGGGKKATDLAVGSIDLGSGLAGGSINLGAGIFMFFILSIIANLACSSSLSLIYSSVLFLSLYLTSLMILDALY